VVAHLGFAKLGAGRDEGAIGWLRRSIEARLNLPIAHFLSAGAFARLGRLEEARDALGAGLELNPSFTIARFRSMTFMTTPSISVAGSGSTRACAWPECRRDDPRLRIAAPQLSNLRRCP
jgi:hypothetical protein